MLRNTNWAYGAIDFIKSQEFCSLKKEEREYFLMLFENWVSGMYIRGLAI